MQHVCFILFLSPSSSDGGWLMTAAEEGEHDDALPPVTLQPLPSQSRPSHRGSSAVTLGVSSISPGQRTSMFGCCKPPYPPCSMPPSSGSTTHQIRRAGGCSSPCSTVSSSNPATVSALHCTYPSSILSVRDHGRIHVSSMCPRFDLFIYYDSPHD